MKLILFCLLFTFTLASDSINSGQTSDTETATSISSPESADIGCGCSVKMEEEEIEEQMYKTLKEDWEFYEDLDSLKSSEILPSPSSMSISSTTAACVSDDATSEIPCRQYPIVPCGIKQEYHKFFSTILDMVPSFRSAELFTVKTIQDLRYIVIVLKPHLGPLFRYFRLEYDWEAIKNDCKNAADEAEFQQLIQMI